MMSTARGVTVALLLLLCPACSSSDLDSPILTDQPSTPGPPEQPPPNYPPLAGPSRTFVFHRELSYTVRDFTRQSRIVLYNNGACALQFAGWEVRGVYSELNGALGFDFGVGSEGTSGSISGDTLTIRYSERMEHSDFENAIYVLSR